MTSNPRHGLPPRLMAHQPTRFTTAQESKPSPSPGIRMSFHQVVHPVLSEEAGVAKLQHLLGGLDERSSECPADAAQSSRTGAAGGGRGTDGEGRRGRFRRNRQNGAQVGGALPDRRRQRPARSLLPAPSPPQADAGSHCRHRRSPAPPALDGPANRSRGRRLAGYDQPHPPAPRPHPHPGARTRHAGSPLRARASRRTDPHRYQKARSLRPRRPSPAIEPVKTSAGASGGSSSTSASTTPPGWPSRRSSLTRRRRARSPSSGPRSPTTRALVSRLPV